MKKITILGSTGSIGRTSLKVIESNPDEYTVLALGAGRNIELLKKQIEKHKPVAVAVEEEDAAACLREKLGDGSIPEVLWGTKGFIHLATLGEVDTVISAVTGAAGLVPTYAAIDAGKDVALANKETMVMAGSMIMDLAERRDVTILPIDSEHNAILQSIQGHSREDLRRVILTASGGPFRDYSIEKMAALTPDMALKHPTWNMGKKITIDSATMMNKGLETIEARWLFDLEMEQISIVIHPESIVHSMVEYRDGSIIAQLGMPDMITPISYALSYPRHMKTPLSYLNIEEIGSLHFGKPDPERFRCLALALEAAETGDSMPAVLNGANEIAVNSFLEGTIGFLQIPVIIEKTMAAHMPFSMDSIEDVLEADKWARNQANRELHRVQI